MGALGRGDLEAAHASVNIVPVKPNSRDELGEMAESFNVLQDEMRKAALGLGEARENLRAARGELLARHRYIAHLAHHDALTNLPNRTALAEQFAQTFVEARENGTSFAVLTVDLDISRRPTTCSAMSLATSCSAPLRDACNMPPTTPSLPGWAAMNFTLILAAGTSPRRPRLWPSACSMP